MDTIECNMPKTIFIFCGGARTFLECFDTAFERVVKKLCPDLSEATLLFYMKLTDPGPKQQVNWNYSYRDTNYRETIEKIESYKSICPQIYHKIMFHSEINDIDLMLQVKHRHLYNGFNEQDIHFIRALHQAYNFERAGQMLLEIQAEKGYEFDIIVYVRPDLFFTSDALPMTDFILDKVIFCTGTSFYSYDHFAIVPKSYMKEFLLDKMATYRTNSTKNFVTPEHLYIQVPHRIETIATYYLKRDLA